MPMKMPVNENENVSQRMPMNATENDRKMLVKLTARVHMIMPSKMPGHIIARVLDEMTTK
jgi:hypothetical protein